MVSKRICFQLENLAVITRFDAVLKHLRLALLDNLLNVFPSFRRLSPDERRTKSLKISFLLAASICAQKL